jgi:hypothetical protein
MMFNLGSSETVESVFIAEKNHIIYRITVSRDMGS